MSDHVYLLSFMLQSLSKIIIIVIELMFLGINMFLTLLRPHFNTRYARAKISLSRAKNIIFMPADINSIVMILRHRRHDYLPSVF